MIIFQLTPALSLAKLILGFLNFIIGMEKPKPSVKWLQAVSRFLLFKPKLINAMICVQTAIAKKR
jgi:hypothetical protein